MPIVARAIDEHLRRVGSYVDFAATGDGSKAGDPDRPVQAIAVSWMSTTAALRRADELGCNLFITHEPTVYSHVDDDPDLRSDACARHKEEFLRRTGMVVYRCHDVWDRMTGEGILDRWAACLGLSRPALAESTYMRVVPVDSQQAGTCARTLAKRLHPYGQPGVQLVGDLNRKIAKIGIGTGAIAVARDLHRMEADAAVLTELTWWRDARWALDADMPLFVVDHTVSEEPGMNALADHLRRTFPDTRAEYIPTGCPWQLVPAAALPPRG